MINIIRIIGITIFKSFSILTQLNLNRKTEFQRQHSWVL